MNTTVMPGGFKSNVQKQLVKGGLGKQMRDSVMFVVSLYEVLMINDHEGRPWYNHCAQGCLHFCFCAFIGQISLLSLVEHRLVSLEGWEEELKIAAVSLTPSTTTQVPTFPSWNLGGKKARGERKPCRGRSSRHRCPFHLFQQFKYSMQNARGAAVALHLTRTRWWWQHGRPPHFPKRWSDAVHGSPALEVLTVWIRIHDRMDWKKIEIIQNYESFPPDLSE